MTEDHITDNCDHCGCSQFVTSPNSDEEVCLHCGTPTGKSDVDRAEAENPDAFTWLGGKLPEREPSFDGAERSNSDVALAKAMFGQGSPFAIDMEV